MLFYLSDYNDSCSEGKAETYWLIFNSWFGKNLNHWLDKLFTAYITN